MQYGGPGKAKPLGDFLKEIEKKAKRGKKALKGRVLAQQAFERNFTKYAGVARVHSVKTGVLIIETDSAAVFQELEGFQREKILEKLRETGLKIGQIRVQLAKN